MSKRNKADLYRLSNPHKVQNQDQYDLYEEHSFDALNYPDKSNKNDKNVGREKKGGRRNGWNY